MGKIDTKKLLRFYEDVRSRGKSPLKESYVKKEYGEYMNRHFRWLAMSANQGVHFNKEREGYVGTYNLQEKINETENKLHRERQQFINAGILGLIGIQAVALFVQIFFSMFRIASSDDVVANRLVIGVVLMTLVVFVIVIYPLYRKLLKDIK